MTAVHVLLLKRHERPSFVLQLAFVAAAVVEDTSGTSLLGSSACESRLLQTCDNARRVSAGNCFLCCGQHASSLRQQGCDEYDFDTFCKPSVGCTSGDHSLQPGPTCDGIKQADLLVRTADWIRQHSGPPENPTAPPPGYRTKLRRTCR